MSAQASEAVTGEPPLALYIHWPFCRSKCPYCDFNSHVRDRIDAGRWERALLDALDHAAGQMPGRRLGSLFFGGGTPSLMAPETVARLIARAKTHWPADPDLEITLEANPTSAEAARFQAFAEAGVNRLSLGVQALREEALRFLGREHDVREALRALEWARKTFPRISFDLIYGRQEQTPADWRAELGQALALAADHLSLYQLTIEAGTAFFQQQRQGALPLPGEPAMVAFYETTQAMLEDAGMPAYEISNHARAGAQCRHNLTYWRGGEYIGIGPGAHGRHGGRRPDEARTTTRDIRLPERWLEAVERQGHGCEAVEGLERNAWLAELTMMGLRLREGLSRNTFRRQTGLEIEAAFPCEALASLITGDFLVLDAAGLRATPRGRQRLNAVLERLLSAA